MNTRDIIVVIFLFIGIGKTAHAQNLPLPNYVSLIDKQTPLRNQGGRTTCITFAALAALEAAYKRAGYADFTLDLSEQFLNYIGKTFWLDTPWDSIYARGEDGKEGQVGAYGGGQAVSYIRGLASGLKVPEETYMPYIPREYTAADYQPLVHNWDDPYWLKQQRMSDFNLNTKFLPPSALTSDRYYSVKTYQEIDGKDVAAFEKILASGKEIAWDMDGAFPGTRIWDVCDRCLQQGAHAMLIVGYDRRDANPKKHVFIVKNSWGRTDFPDGYTRVTYDYVKKYGISAAYITEVNPPSRWYELGFVGRWFVEFDGHKGILDIYHIPHVSEYVFKAAGDQTVDMRIGSFYENGKAYKVNGNINGKTIRFYVDPDNPNVRWDVLKGRVFTFNLLDDKSNIMAGRFTDTDKRVYGGYARKDRLTPFSTFSPTGTPNFLFFRGQWKILFAKTEGSLQVTGAAESSSNGFQTYEFDKAHTYQLFNAGFTVDGTVHDAKLFLEKDNPNHVVVEIADLLNGNNARHGGYLDGLMFNFDKSTVAGTAHYGDGQQLGFVMFKQQQGR